MKFLVMPAVFCTLLSVSVAGPLAGLPGTPGPTVARIDTMSDNSWIDLGDPAPDPVWGYAHGAAWTPKMVYAPDLRGAFYMGAGKHCYVSKGHWQDDLWFYDVNAHRWICAYAGMPFDSLNSGLGTPPRLDSNGFLTRENGDLLPVMALAHGYQMQSYDTDQNKFVVMPSTTPAGVLNFCGGLTGLADWLSSCAAPDCGSRHYRHPWYYNVETGKWEHPYVSTGTAIEGRHEGCPTEYIPGRRLLLHLRWYDKAFYYDHAANEWTQPPVTGSGSTYDPAACYDTKRNRIYAGLDSTFKAFEIDSNRWIALDNSVVVKLKDVSQGFMNYDAANDVVVSVNSVGSLNAYHPDTDTWESLGAAPSSNVYRPQLNSFYDPVLNVHYVNYAYDSGDQPADQTMMVYRYKKTAASINRRSGMGVVPADGLSASPNPFSGAIAIRASSKASVVIFDISGRMVAAHVFSAGEGAWAWNPRSLPAGLYVLKAKMGEGTLVRKVLFQK